MDMTPEYKRIYKDLGPEDRRAFREAVELDDLSTIAKYTGPIEYTGKKGRPAADLKKLNKQKEYATNKAARRVEAPTGFNCEIVPEASAVDLDQLNNFKDLYNLTIERVQSQFFIDNEYVINKHPSIWYNRLLIALKKELPRITIKEPARVAVAWEAFKNLMYNIGLFPTREAFQNLTDIYIDVVNKQLTPEWVALRAKMISDSRGAMIDQVNTNPLTQINKLFILKSVYGFKESGPDDLQQVEHKTRNINELPFFSNNDLPGDK